MEIGDTMRGTDLPGLRQVESRECPIPEPGLGQESSERHSEPDIDSISEPARRTPVFRRCDVLVVGGGPAGCAAATSAARMGVDTLLVERYGHLGGMSTGGLVVWIDKMTDWEGQKIVTGYADELLARMPDDAVVSPPEEAWGSQDPETLDRWRAYNAVLHETVMRTPVVDPEMLKMAYSDLLLERSGGLLLHAWAVAPLLDGDALYGVVFESKSGRRAILAQVVIDATGDGDIFAAAGADFETDISPRSTNRRVNVSFRMGGVDLERYVSFQIDRPAEHRAVLGRARKALGHGVGMVPLPREGTVVCMGPKLAGYSPIDVASLTACEIESRRKMLETIDFFRQHMPGFERAWLMDTSPQLGVRHSRRLVGVKKVTRQDWDVSRPCEDEVGLCPPASPHQRPISIPLGSLLPVRVDNLLAAGRNLSCDWQSHNLLREVPVCWVIGQGAGVAAAVAVKARTRVRDVDVAEVQRQLRAQGVRLSR